MTMRRSAFAPPNDFNAFGFKKTGLESGQAGRDYPRQRVVLTRDF